MADVQVGVRIRGLRERGHYTRGELAERVGITAKALCEIERGERDFSADTLCRLAQALAVSCDYIMLGEEEEQQEFSQFFCTLENMGPERRKRVMALLEVLEEVSDFV